MNPREFNELAKKLANSRSPAEIRSAISRAYYAAFNVGLEILGGMDPKWKSLDHDKLPDYLQLSGDAEFQEIASRMDEFRTIRNSADYHMDNLKPEDRNTANLWCLHAEHIMKTLEDRGKGPNRKRIVDALRDYERRINVR